MSKIAPIACRYCGLVASRMSDEDCPDNPEAEQNIPASSPHLHSNRTYVTKDTWDRLHANRVEMERLREENRKLRAHVALAVSYFKTFEGSENE